MTFRFVAARRAWGQIRQHGVVGSLAAIVIAAVVALAAVGAAERRSSDGRLATQTFDQAVDEARTIFDRDRRMFNRMADMAAAGSPLSSALPDLPRNLDAVGLFDAAGTRLAIISLGLDDRAIASVGDAIARAVALHPDVSPVVVTGIPDGRTALVALAQPWTGADGFSGGIAAIVFSQVDLPVFDRSPTGRFDIVAADGSPLFPAATEPAVTAARLTAIPGLPLMLRYQPPVDHPAPMLRADASFALLAVAALAGALGLAKILIRRERAAQREIARRATVERKLRDELTVTAAAASRTDESNRVKSRFFTQVTHELRTPLNAILGFSETIRQEMFGPVTNPRYLEYAGLIHDAGSHLLSLINDLLDNARIEAGKMEIAPIRVSAAAVSRSALDLVELLAAERKVTLAATGFDSCPDLNVDPRALKQVLVNLLSNAIKYTPADGRIEMRFAERAEGGVTIEVADTGTGMSAEEVLYAFEPFGRAGAGQLRRQPGTGLGLSLARALVRLHGGDLTLASRLDVGTTATVSLPASAAFGATGAAPASAKNAARTAPARAA